jgi:hypothetical protein
MSLGVKTLFFFFLFALIKALRLILFSVFLILMGCEYVSVVICNIHKTFRIVQLTTQTVSYVNIRCVEMESTEYSEMFRPKITDLNILFPDKYKSMAGSVTTLFKSYHNCCWPNAGDEAQAKRHPLYRAKPFAYARMRFHSIVLYHSNCEAVVSNSIRNLEVCLCFLSISVLLGAFAKLRKATISFVVSFRPSVRPSVCLSVCIGQLGSC